MGTILLNRHLSPFDILVKNFFQSEEQFQTPNNKIINHPVDIYEDENGIYFDIACTGLNKKQVNEVCKVADLLDIPVMCYGIRTDFRGELFEGSSSLLALADKLEELKTICTECNRKATMVIRLDKDSKVVTSGKQILIGGNETYKVLCRKHFNEMTKLLD